MSRRDSKGDPWTVEADCPVCGTPNAFRFCYHRATDGPLPNESGKEEVRFYCPDCTIGSGGEGMDGWERTGEIEDGVRLVWRTDEWLRANNERTTP